MPRVFKRETGYERAWRRGWARVMALAEEPRRLAVVQGLLARGEVWRMPSSVRGGATLAAAQLAVAVSHGREVLGQPTRRTNVLYLAADDSLVEWELGVAPWLGKTDRWFRVVFGPFDLDRKEGMARLRATVEFGGVGLVVVDPLRFAVSRGVLRRVVEGLEALAREKDVAVVVVHNRRMAGVRELGPQLESEF